MICPMMSRPVTNDMHHPRTDLFDQPCIGSRCAWWIRRSQDSPIGGCGIIAKSYGKPGNLTTYTFFPDPAREASE